MPAHLFLQGRSGHSKTGKRMAETGKTQ